MFEMTKCRNTNVHNVESQIKHVHMISHLYPRCVYTPAIVSDMVCFQQRKDSKAQIPPERHLDEEEGVYDTDEYIWLAHEVRESHAYNCDGMLQPIRSKLNVVKWAEYLEKYDDTRLLQFLMYGFPLGDWVKFI